jgi:hypothetical protein
MFITAAGARGWSKAEVQTRRIASIFGPCLYAHHNDARSWTEVGTAIRNGAVCGAAWIVFEDTSTFPIAPWQAKFTSPRMPAVVRVAITQRILDLSDLRRRRYDFDLVNPARQDWLLPRLGLPQAIPVS